jgi:hypothetical protein
MRCAAVLAIVCTGCTALGATMGAAEARDQNARRELAVAHGSTEAPPEASVAGRAIATGLVGAAIDIVLVSAYLSYSHRDEPAMALPSNR